MYDNEIKGEFNDNYRYAHDYWAPLSRTQRYIHMPLQAMPGHKKR